MKEGFIDWLKTQKENSKIPCEQTIQSYVKELDKICAEYNESWESLRYVIIPLLAKYYEFAHHEYKVDTITIDYAIHYFEMLADYLTINENLDMVELFLYDGNNYLIDTIPLNVLGVYIKLFKDAVYNHLTPDNKKLILIKKEFVEKIHKIIQTNKIKDTTTIALRIIYSGKKNLTRKKALSKYCQYLSKKFKIPIYADWENKDPFVFIKEENPEKKINHQFKFIRKITGRYSAQVVATRFIKKRIGDDITNYSLTASDLKEIFDVDKNTAMDIPLRYIQDTKASKIKTCIGVYYNVNIVNQCLEHYHKFVDVMVCFKKIPQIMLKYQPSICYDKEGYEQWCTQDKAMKILGIKRVAFQQHIKNHCPRIDYAEKAPKYYIPTLKFLKNLPEIRRIKLRKKYTFQ